MIVLTDRGWRQLWEALGLEHVYDTHSPYGLRSRRACREELGFTWRRYEFRTSRTRRERWWCLDFYDDAMESWFILKHAHLLEGSTRSVRVSPRDPQQVTV